MSLLQIPTTPPQSTPIEVDRGDATLPGLLSRAYWLFLSGVQSVLQLMATAVDYLQTNVVYGGPSLTHVNRVTKVTAVGTIGESSIKDDGTNVSLTEPLHSDTGATPANSQVAMAANALGALEMLAYAADNVKLLFDVKWTGSALVCANGSICVLLKNGAKLNVYGGIGNVVGNAPAALNNLVTIDLNTGDIDAVTGKYRIAGAAGITGALTLTLTTQAVQYKDWAGANQTVTVVTNATLTANAFTGGIRTT